MKMAEIAEVGIGWARPYHEWTSLTPRSNKALGVPPVEGVLAMLDVCPREKLDGQDPDQQQGDTQGEIKANGRFIVNKNPWRDHPVLTGSRNETEGG
jgi:hypothetical protein